MGGEWGVGDTGSKIGGVEELRKLVGLNPRTEVNLDMAQFKRCRLP